MDCSSDVKIEEEVGVTVAETVGMATEGGVMDVKTEVTGVMAALQNEVKV